MLVRRHRRAGRGTKAPGGLFEGAPDLAVEVISPSEGDEAVHAKLLEYLRAGTGVVWVVRPLARTVEVCRSLSDIRVMTEGDTLDGEGLLPGFRLPVREVFE
jgi:Uma2 family endonuclease